MASTNSEISSVIFIAYYPQAQIRYKDYVTLPVKDFSACAHACLCYSRHFCLTAAILLTTVLTERPEFGSQSSAEVIKELDIFCQSENSTSMETWQKTVN